MHLAFGFILGLWALASSAQNADHDAIDRSLKSLKKIVSRYMSEMDSKVRLTELQSAIETIDRSMIGYRGRAKHRLDGVRSLSSSAGLSYQRCVNPIFEWCVSVNSTLDLFLPNVESTQLSPAESELLWNIMATSIRDGVKKALDSLNSLHQLELKTNQLKIELDRMMADLNSDFGANGEYTRREGKLRSDITEIRAGSRRYRGQEDRGVGVAISRLYQAILAFLRSLSVGDIVEAFSPTEYCAEIDDRRIASKEEEIRMIHKFFEVLSQRIAYASSVAEEVDAGLGAEKPNLEAVTPPNKVFQTRHIKEITRHL